MAKILLSDLLDDIAGKFAGSVFQRSTNCLMMRRWVAPRNPGYSTQQFARGSMSFIRRNWQNLTEPERESWIDLDVTKPAISNYIASNQLIARSGNPFLAEFDGTVPIADIIILVFNLNPTAINIRCESTTRVLGEGQYLLIYSTSQRNPGTYQISRQSFTWLQTFPPGTDIGANMSILSSFEARYGTPTPNRVIALRAIIVNVGTGVFTNTSLTEIAIIQELL